MPLVAILQHIACETAGLLERALTEAGVEFHYVRTFAGDRVPSDPEDYSGIVAMGGPMGVYEAEEFPNLKQEMALLVRACRSGVPVLGVCLGSQLLAAALGADVRPSGFKEIGWQPVTLTPEAALDPLCSALPPRFVPLHWHGDIFDLPAGATCLARSELTAVQAYRWGETAYGLLFHLESTGDTLRQMAATFHDELAAAKIDPHALLAEGELRLQEIAPLGQELFRRWAQLTVGYAGQR